MKFSACIESVGDVCPAPQGAGGLKSRHVRMLLYGTRPAPQGAGGLKLYLICHLKICARPAPQGAGGLKSIFGFFTVFVA